MSMLTPPGMGGKYRITGDRYPRMRRPRNRRRIVLASVGAVTVLGLGGWGTLQLIDIFSGGTEARAAGSHANSKDCTTEAKSKQGRKGAADDKGTKLPEPGSITVNVLNATGRGGLAKDTADALKKRGFRIGTVDNAPSEYDKKVKPVGLLLGATGPDTAGRLKVLGTQLKGADTRYDGRKGDDVDLVIGDGYKKLTKEKEAGAALTALAHPRPSPSGSHCAH